MLQAPRYLNPALHPCRLRKADLGGKTAVEDDLGSEAALAEKRLQFGALFTTILDKQKANFDHSDEKCIELRMYLFIVENELHSAFQMLKLPFAYTCASWFPT